MPSLLWYIFYYDVLFLCIKIGYFYPKELCIVETTIKVPILGESQGIKHPECN